MTDKGKYEEACFFNYCYICYNNVLAHRYLIHLGIFEGACGLSALQVIEGDQTKYTCL